MPLHQGQPRHLSSSISAVLDLFGLLKPSTEAKLLQVELHIHPKRRHTRTYCNVLDRCLFQFIIVYFILFQSFMHDSTAGKSGWLKHHSMVGRWWYEMLKFILKCSWGTSLWPLEIQQVYRSFGSFGSFLRRRFPVEPSVIFANFSSVLVPLTPRHLWSSSQRSAIDDMLYNEPDCRYILYSGCMQVVQTCSNHIIYIPWFQGWWDTAIPGNSEEDFCS